ncbi:MAG: SUF system NifU family Fe-S cluster assembly protein [Acidobacteria bacterium]|nr:MAG: SUF system NifU family Fe-S cluster assembly protein [Acidobacteriota bacterium]MCE7960626.1 SUF system NifU family Fe-S cluster assembly protein [Acidobacteria bacterium ACB2]
MTDLAELYQELILDHNRAPRNYGTIPDPNRKALGHNPLCGDQFTLFLRVEEDVVKEVVFQGKGCAISKASASLMTEAVKGKTVAEAEALFRRFHELVTGPPDAKADTKGLGKLAVFAGVREYPARVKCASLAWHTLHAALEGRDETSTEE